MIRIEQLLCRVGQGQKSFTLGPLDLEVAPGEYFVLLGQTGSGKTMLLECLCGLTPLSRGAIYLQNLEKETREITHLAPRFRQVAYVPQDYALFPHLTVRQNIAFSLNGKSRRMLRRVAPESNPDAEARKVHQMAELMQIAHLLPRSCRKLSGGEKQRTALARALVANPQVLLLDEPVSALDEVSRMRLLGLLKSVQRTTGLPTIHVCHDLTEMAMVADRVGVLEGGKILQVGTPQELYHRPANYRVARFLRCENYLPVTQVVATASGTVRVRFAQGMELDLPQPSVPERVCRDPLSMMAVIRPEYIELSPPRARRIDEESPHGLVSAASAVVEKVADLGATVTFRLRLQGDAPAETEFVDDRVLTAEIGKAVHLENPRSVGDRVDIAFPAQMLHFIPREDAIE